jgi:hypothetical protein
MQNQNPKHIREHRKRKVAEFNELARSWVPEKYLAAVPTMGDLTSRQQAAFMTFDYFMCTGGEDEVRRLISFLTRSLELWETMYGKGGANN